MKEKICKKGDKIIIEIPYWSKRINPYIPNKDTGKYKTLTGILEKDENGNEDFGFALTIDMDYKGKPDQFTSIKYHYWDDEESFIKLCKELNINIVDLRANSSFKRG